MSLESWAAYYDHLLWGRRRQAESFEATFLGGPKDGEVWALRRGVQHIVVAQPMSLVAAMKYTEQFPTEAITISEVVVPVCRRWTPLIWEDGDDPDRWCVGVVEKVLVWPRGAG